MRTAAAAKTKPTFPSTNGSGSNRSAITPAVPAKEIAMKIAKNA